MLSRATRTVGETLAALLAPILSSKSIAELDALFAFISSKAVLEQLFTDPQCEEYREAILKQCEDAQE